MYMCNSAESTRNYKQTARSYVFMQENTGKTLAVVLLSFTKMSLNWVAPCDPI